MQKFTTIDSASKWVYSFSGSVRRTHAEPFSKCIYSIGCSIEYVSYTGASDAPYFEDFVYPDIGIESYYQQLERGNLVQMSKDKSIFNRSMRKYMPNISVQSMY